jgi:hypothetical protein
MWRAESPLRADLDDGFVRRIALRLEETGGAT